MIGALCLSGCATAPGETVMVTPSLPSWPPEAQADVAAEIEACPAPMNATVRALGDYIGLRDAIRAAQQE